MRSIRTSLPVALYAAFIVSASFAFLRSYPLPEFQAKLVAIAGAGFVFLFCSALGRSVVSKSMPPGLALPASFFIGFGFLGISVLALGWIFPGDLGSKMTVLAFVGGGLILFRLRDVQGMFSALNESILQLAPFSLSETLISAIGIGGVAVCFLACFSPITYYDSLVYHLALPSMYLKAGRIIDVPSNLYSYFPANVEMVFLFILSKFPEPEYVINLFGWVGSVLISAGICQWSHEIGGRRAALLSFLLWWTMPAVLFLSLGAYVDISLAGFIFLAVRLFSVSLEKNWEIKPLILSGLLSGFAFSAKYTGAVVVPILLLCGFIHMARSGKFWKLIAIFVLAASFAPLFWLLKNWINIRNPVFPFLYSYFGSHSGWSADSASGYFSQLTEYGTKSHVLFDLLISPWMMTASAVKFGGGFDVLGDFGWPVFIFLSPLAIFVNKKSRVLRFLTYYAALHFLFWFLGKPVLRFLIGLLPIAAVLSALSFSALLRRGKQIGLFASAFLGIWLLSNFFMYWIISDGIKPYQVSTGLSSQQEFLKKRLTYFPVYEYANAELKNKTILVLGEQRTYHLKVPFLAANLFSKAPIADEVNKAKTPQEISQFLSRHNVSAIIVNESEIMRLGGFGRFGFTEEGEISMNLYLTKNCTILAENRGVKLYRINYIDT